MSRALRICKPGTLSMTVVTLVFAWPESHPVGAEAAAKHRNPNIIFIMADDLGYGDLGCYGQEKIRTPHIDRLAKEGMRFTDFYAGSTVCAPSRCVLMTGLHLGHCRVRGNSPVPERQSLRNEDLTVAELLKGAGYATALIGKWGLGGPETEGVPNKQGFDYFFGYLSQLAAHNYYPPFLWRNDSKVELGNKVDLIRVGKWGSSGVATKRVDYSHDLFIAESLRFIDGHRQERFFLYLALTIPHANNEARRKLGDGQEVPDYGIYDEKDWPNPDKGQAAMITRMDAGVGHILARLKALGIDKNTIVFFTSDNGHHAEGGNRPDFFDANGPLRGMKRDLYEGGIRVPFLAYWPGTIKPGTTSDHIGYFGDLMATAADLAGVRQPGDLDSISFLPVLLGQTDKQEEHGYLYWEFYERGSAQAVRMGRWKAVRKPFGSDNIELYDLQDDLGEQQDVADKRPEVAAKLRTAMAEAHVPSPLWKVRAPRPNRKIAR